MEGNQAESFLIAILTKVDVVWEVREGPTLPRPVASHCSVTINDGYYDKVILIGGASFDSQERKFVMTDIVESYEFENGGRYSSKTNLASLLDLAMHVR